MMTRFLFVTVLVLTATGCAVGREHAYDTIHPRVVSEPTSGALVAVAVHDERSEVRSRDKDPDFVGLSRGGYGNPFDITTKSGAPLANDLAKAIGRSLSDARYRVQVASIAHDMDPAQALKTLARAGARVVLLVRIHRLKSDTYQNTALHYDLEAQVLDGRQKVLGRATQAGTDNLGGSAWNPGGYADRVVPPAVQQKLQLLLNDPQIAQALRGALSDDTNAVARSAPNS